MVVIALAHLIQTKEADYKRARKSVLVEIDKRCI